MGKFSFSRVYKLYFIVLKFINIYLLYENLLPPQQGWHAPTPRKERRRKEQGAEKMEEKKDQGTIPLRLGGGRVRRRGKTE